MKTTPDLGRIAQFADDLEVYGQGNTAHALRTALDRVTDAWAEWWNESLSIADAVLWGGYSASQLRRSIKDGTIAAAPSGGIRRRHVPVKPGHEPPLGLEPAVPSIMQNLVDEVTERRRAS